MRLILLLVLVGMLSGCRTADSNPTDAADDVTTADWWHGGDSRWPEDDLGEPGADLRRSPDRGSSEVLTPENTPPTLAAIPPVSLPMGQSTTVDLVPLLGDAEDPVGLLELSWSADHVGIEDPGDHVLYVVAPVDWHGTEVIDITVTDSGGLTASAPLKVLVDEVTAPDPVEPTPECGETTLEYTPDGAVDLVLLSGSFNDWADSKESGAAVLADSDNNGTYTVTLVLEPGTHQYKFIVDGEWLPDPANPDTVDDGYGGVNSILEVPPCE